MPSDSRLSRRAALVGLLTLSLSRLSATYAQTGRPVRFLLSVSPGSGVDVVTRACSRSLEVALGQPVVVENQPGAGGLLGTQALMKAPPDGFTLSVISPNHVIFPEILKNVAFHPVNDFTPIAIVGSTPLILAVNPKLLVKNLAELLALMRTKPESVTYGSAGNGSFLHLGAAAFLDAAGVKGQHIPYKGGNAMLTDLMAGQIDLATLGLPQVIGQVKNGTLRPLAVLARQRTPLLPDLPTAAEQGISFAMDGWFAVIGPKGMAAQDVRRVHAAVEKAFTSQEAKDAMAAQGAVIAVSTPEHARSFLLAESARFADVVKKAGVVAQ